MYVFKLVFSLDIHPRSDIPGSYGIIFAFNMNLKFLSLRKGVGDGQGGLACCNLWGRKESDTTERLN